MEPAVRTRRKRFGAFEVDLHSGEVYKYGVRLKLQDQPFQVLALLLERSGDLVTREELRQKLWPADTFVDFDTGLNSVIKKLRDVLGDSAEEPRYIETLPRRGYRFVAVVENGVPAASPAAVDEHPEPVLPSPPTPQPRNKRRLLIAAGVDVKASTQNNTLDVHPLALTILRPDDDEACVIAERLILGGATSSPADAQFRTIFFRIVAAKKAKLASTIMRCDPNANAVINFPCVAGSNVIFPLVVAIHERDYSMTAVLLAYGARLQLLEEDITKAIATRFVTYSSRVISNLTNVLS